MSSATTLLPDDLVELTDAELIVWIRLLQQLETEAQFDWSKHARPDQLPPEGQWGVWLLLGGRGAGKTRTGSETMRGWAEADPMQHLAVVAKTHREVLNICFEAPRAGLIRVVPPEEIVRFLRGSGSVELELKNGSKMRAFSAQDPEAMRGYAFDKVWLDEYAAYPIKLAQVVYDMAWFCMRESPDPRMVISTTPKPVPHIKKLIERAMKRPDRVVITRSKTRDNVENLSDLALEELEEMYAGTRLGRQELDAELLEDVEGALWKLSWIERGRVDPRDVPADLVHRYVSIDPAETVSETSDETGIIVGGVDRNHEVYVLADWSMKIAGLAAAYRIWQAYIEYGCEAVIIENSSLWCLDLLELAWRDLQTDGHVPPGDPPIKIAMPFANKQMRAMPIAGLYEKDPTPVHHVGIFAELESQLTTWTPEETPDSPDRLDALVYLVGELKQAFGKEAVIQSAAVKAARDRERRGIVGPGRGRRPAY